VIEGEAQTVWPFELWNNNWNNSSSSRQIELGQRERKRRALSKFHLRDASLFFLDLTIFHFIFHGLTLAAVFRKCLTI